MLTHLMLDFQQQLTCHTVGHEPALNDDVPANTHTAVGCAEHKLGTTSACVQLSGSNMLERCAQLCSTDLCI